MPGSKRPSSPSNIPVRQVSRGEQRTPPLPRRLSEPRAKTKISNGEPKQSKGQPQMTKLPTPVWSRRQSLDKPKDKDFDSQLDLNQEDPDRSGVMYITENLIRKISKEDNLKNITHLSLTLARETNRKIKYIENLDALVNLQHLSLAHNQIEKIEKLDPLTKLQGLDLSNNQIKKIEGLDMLVNLQVLSLNDNFIASLPTVTWKKLGALRALKLSSNRISSTHELLKLRHLPDLTDIIVEGNPFCSLSHHREIIICHLRSLETIDGIDISQENRAEADERYGQNELREVTEKLFQAEKKLSDALAKSQELEETIGSTQQSEKRLKASLESSKKRIKTLEDDVKAQEEVLNTKNAELSRACEKQYKLEQELAFFKLDAKFEELWKSPQRQFEFPDNDYVDSGDSTYIGKAKFKRNAYAKELALPSREQLINFIRFVRSGDPESKATNQELIKALQEALEIDLTEKQQAIVAADEKLQQIHAKLQDAAAKAADATTNHVGQPASSEKLSDVKDREQARLELIEMIKKAKELQGTIQELRDKLQEVEHEKKAREDEIAKLNEVIGSLAEDNPNLERLKGQLEVKQRHLSQNLLEKAEIEKLLDDAEQELEKRIREIRSLEAKLRGGEVDAQDQIRKELEGVVDKLSKSLKELKAKDRENLRKLEVLEKEKAKLAKLLQQVNGRAKDMEEKLMSSDGLQGNVTTLLQKLSDADAELMTEKERCEKLQKEYDELYRKTNKKRRNVGVGHGDVFHDPLVSDLESQLQQARKEASRIQEALELSRKQHEADRQSFENKLKKERGRLEDAVEMARAVGDKEKEARELASHVRALQSELGALQDQLHSTQQELAREVDSSVPKGYVVEQLDALSYELGQGRVKTYPSVLSTTPREQKLKAPFEKLREKVAALLGELEAVKDDRQLLLDRMDEEKKYMKDKLVRAEEKAKRQEGEMSQMQRKYADAQDNFHRLEDEFKKVSNAHLGQIKQLQDHLNDALLKAEQGFAKAEKAEKDLVNAERKGAKADEDRRNILFELETLKAELEDAHRDLGYLKDKLASEQGRWREQMENETRRAEDLIRAMADNVRELERELERSKANGDNMRKMVEEMRARNEELVGNLQKSKKDLQEKFVETSGKLKRAEDENRALKESIYAMENNVEQLRQQIQKLRESADKQIQSERAKYVEEMRELGRQVDDTRDQIRKLKDHYENEVTKVESENKALKNDLQVTNERLKQYENDRDNLLRMDHDLDLLRNSFRSLEVASKEKDHLRTLYAQIAQEVERLGNEVALLSRRSYDVEQVARDAQHQTARDIADAQTRVAKLQAALAKKEEELRANRDGDNPIIRAQRHEISNLVNRLQQKTTELDALRKKLNRSRVVTAADQAETGYILQDVTPFTLEETRDGYISPGIEVHHHHYSKEDVDTSKTGVRVDLHDASLPRGNVVVYHHHDDDEKKKKKRSSKRRSKKIVEAEEFCNVAEHEDLERELNIVEEKLDRSVYNNTRALLSSRSPLSLELRAIEDKVSQALLRRSLNRSVLSYH